MFDIARAYRCVGLSACAAVCTSASAGVIDDPSGLLTSGLQAQATYYTLSESESQWFTPASTASECAHATVGASGAYSATTAISTGCSSDDVAVNVIRMTWSNDSLTSEAYGISAEGRASCQFSVASDSNLSLATISSIESLAAEASWSLLLFDDATGTLVGNAGSTGSLLSLQENTMYRLVFSITGTDTTTIDGSTVMWEARMAHSFAAVPGGSCLGALGLVGFRGVRRRRRA